MTRKVSGRTLDIIRKGGLTRGSGRRSLYWRGAGEYEGLGAQQLRALGRVSCVVRLAMGEDNVVRRGMC